MIEVHKYSVIMSNDTVVYEIFGERELCIIKRVYGEGMPGFSDVSLSQALNCKDLDQSDKDFIIMNINLFSGNNLSLIIGAAHEHNGEK